MIKYQLVCDADHEFEGWFGDSAAFEDQSRSGLLQCPVCGTGDVRRALMAPNLASPKTRAKAGNAVPPAPDAAASGSEGAPQGAAVHTGSMPPASPAGGPVAGLPPEAAQKMAALITEMRSVQAKIRSECRDVGDQFAEEARKMHYGEAEAEGIYGQATPEEREALDEEGIAVVEMPWLPKDN
jgi:hypothetical protein